MILPNHLEFEKFIEELNVLYKEIEKYCKYNLFEVIGVTQYDLEKLYTLNRLLKSVIIFQGSSPTLIILSFREE